MRSDPRRWRSVAALAAAGVLVASCTATPDAEVERSMAAVGELRPDRDVVVASSPSLPPADDGDGRDPVGPADSSLLWGGCEEFGLSAGDGRRSDRWECARLAVPMDPSDPEADLAPVSLALTRHPATGDRVGSLLMNPGGPGGAGLPLAWSVRSAFPPELLRGFDIVSWDPRGVGRSEPAATCPAGADPDDVDYIASCVEATGALSAHLAAPYSVADMEAIRVALGEERLDYLGYSYGSILGATYAERHSDRVGSFVLDGVTDPDVGSVTGPFSGGFPTFADDGLPAALERFAELCGATTLCLGDGLGSDPAATQAAIDAIVDGAADLPTDDHAGVPERLSAEEVDDEIAVSMGSASDWELLGAGLADAQELDGSNLAALIGGPADEGSDDGDDGVGGGDFEAANFLIYCADLGPLIEDWGFCDSMPTAADPLTPIAPVELDHPILVIGTEYDPLTPGHHAPDFAERLGDAVWMIWDGVGHTAFPGWARCIDDAVADHLLQRATPPSGTRCGFVDGVVDDEELAEGLFGFDVNDGRPWLAAVLEARGVADGERLECVVAQLVPADDVDDRVVAEVILGVTSTAAVDALDGALATC